jgi:hypothetical protein
MLVDPLLLSRRQKIRRLVAIARLPTAYGIRDYPVAGGLMSYDPGQRQISRRAADYVDKLLKGARPADLPVEQPTKFEFVINLKTAKALGLNIPSALLATADEVIEYLLPFAAEHESLIGTKPTCRRGRLTSVAGGRTEMDRRRCKSLRECPATTLCALIVLQFGRSVDERDDLVRRTWSPCAWLSLRYQSRAR